MFTEGFENLLKQKSLSTPLTEWNKTCMEMCRRIAQKNMDIMGENVARFSERLKQFSNIRKPEEFINWQKKCIEEDLTAGMEYMQEMIHTSMENMEELSKTCKSTYGHLHDTAMSTAKTATKTAEKATRKAEKTFERAQERPGSSE